MFEAIKSAPEERIVVTHGTDTLIESAQHLQSRSELFFPKKKIVLTGSFLPQVFKDSDADFNVGSAIGFLQSDSTDFGVYIAINGIVLKSFEASRNESGLFIRK